MAIDSILSSEVLTSEDRWRLWAQRGRDDVARFVRQMRLVFWSGVVVVTAVLVMFVPS